MDRPRASIAALALVAACGGSPEQAPDLGAAPSQPPELPRTSSLPAWGVALADTPTELRSAELARDAKADALIEAAAGDASWRALAYRSLARIDPPTRLDDWIALVQRADPAPTAAELAAIGLLERPPGASEVSSWNTLEDALWSRYAVTEDPEQRSALLFAIGRLGEGPTQIRLAADLGELDELDGAGRAVAGFGAMTIACARGHAATADGLSAIGAAVHSDLEGVASAAAGALARCAAPSAERLAGAARGGLARALQPLVEGDDPDAARVAYKAFAGLGEVPEPVPAAVLGPSPPPWLVEVEAVTALAGHADGRVLLAERLRAVELSQFTDARGHVLLAALRALRKSVDASPELLRFADAMRPQVEAARGSTEPRRAKLAALLACEMSVLDAIRSGELGPLLDCDDAAGLPDGYAETLAVEALLIMGTARPRPERLRLLFDLGRDDRSWVAATALASLAEVDGPEVAEVLRGALASDDPGVLAAAAGAIAARSIDASRRDPQAVEPLAAMLERMPNGSALEARVAAVEALGNLARSAPQTEAAASSTWLREVVLPLHADPARAIRDAARKALIGAPDLVEEFDSRSYDAPAPSFAPEVQAGLAAGDGEAATGLRVHTEAGAFTIAFADAPAPIMQANLARLADQRFFDGLRFHRIVPGFVVQGGDPRGDGYGGPGWLVPCERSNLRYERGTVGIALAGRDTGGSQFFVAQTAQPHLDGRYTVIGRVTEGLDVIDRLLPHDRIDRVEVLR